MVTPKNFPCAFCKKGIAHLTIEETTLRYKQENFTVNAHFYKCDNCSEEFTTTLVDDITLNQVYKQHSEKYGQNKEWQ